MKWGLERFRGYKPRLKPCLPWKGDAGEEEDKRWGASSCSRGYMGPATVLALKKSLYGVGAKG